MRKTLLSVLLMTTVLSLHAEDGHRLWLRNNDEIAKKLTFVLESSMPDDEGFRYSGDTIYSHSEAGLMYGKYDVERKLALRESLKPYSSSPAFKYRILNHWDNPDGSIERGYAGKSIFEWFNLDSSLLEEYARANASLGINGSVLNNVNASPKILSPEYLQEVKKIADILRPYHIKVYLSINFASPMVIGGQKTADPLNKNVQKWWKRKAAEIYKLIPDFGGFLVKANSENQPGPGDYHRSHADGANMLADAVAPYGGIIMWRSFVYGANHKGEDRVKQAVSEFKELDGTFRQNVILQSKNGPLDFQPREPYAPIFDNMKKTPQMAELQITQEYLGHSIHLVYLAPMWKEFFEFVSPSKLVGVAGVANIGKDRNWCGHHFAQANWYAFGRLAWNPQLSSDEIAEEWLLQTFNDHYRFVKEMKDVMLSSREACVDYMMPLGLHHIFKFDHHYGPGPEDFNPHYPIEWCPVYYHQADKQGVGFDRTTETGSDAVSQYREPFASLYNDINTCPEEYLLWFHHVPWTYKMKDGKTLWQSLNEHYAKGVSMVEGYVDTWRQLRPYVDEQRWKEVDDRLQKQLENAREWEDVCMKYFGSFAEQAE